MKKVFLGQPDGLILSLSCFLQFFGKKQPSRNAAGITHAISAICSSFIFPFRRGSMQLGRLLGFVLFFCFSVSLNAQSLGRQLIGSAGGTGRIGDLQISWSLGEVAVARLNAANGGEGQLTEGFQQPRLLPLSEGMDPLSVQIAPNPVRNILQIYLPGDAKVEWTLTLNDVTGKTLLRRTGLTVGNAEIDLGPFPSGVYFLGLSRNATGEIGQTLKVLKL